MLHLPLNATVFACFNCMRFCHFGDRTKKKNMFASVKADGKKKKVTTRRPEFFFFFARVLGYSRKTKQKGLMTCNFQGVLKKEYMEIPGVVLLKKRRISRHVQEKNCGNYMGLGFWIEIGNLEFPRSVTEFCRISKGASLFSLEFLRVKWKV